MRQRIKIAIEKIPDGDIKKLKGYTKTYRLRVGDWRILFDIDMCAKIIGILPRGQACKKWTIRRIFMDTQRKQLHDLVDIVDISEYETIYHWLMKFIPEDTPTEDEIQAIKKGKQEIFNGEFVNQNDIDWGKTN